MANLNGISTPESKIWDLERLIHVDPGNRGLKGIWEELEALHRFPSLYNLGYSASTLYSGCKKALVATGFIIPSVQKPETDGPPGALAICRALHFLGREVSLITAPGNAPLLRALLAYESEKFGYTIPLIEAPLLKDVENKQEWAKEALSDYDHLISIEILGAASDGGYYNMRGIEVSEFNSPIDVLWDLALQDGLVKTTSIGDGGNEIGMGNLHDLVARHVPKGQITGCKVKCNFLITAGVSNWGGYALACALYLLEEEKQKADGQSADERMLPNEKVESELLNLMLANGGVDGPTCAVERKVDSFDFEYHAELIESMLQKCGK
jgi:hypothetical protein